MNVRIEYDIARGSYDVFVVDRRGRIGYAAAPSNLVMESIGEAPEGACLREKIKPWISISDYVARELFAALTAELARIGFRDAGREPAMEDALAAKDKHLEDMRRIVFRDFPKDGPAR